MKSTYLLLTLVATSLCYGAKRPPSRNLVLPEKAPSSSQHEKMIYVPLWAITPESTNDQSHERTLFLALMAIAGTVGKIMLDPTNTLSIIEHVTCMVDNLAFAANATDCTSGRSDKKALIEALTKYIQEQAQLVIASTNNQSQSATESKSAHDTLVEYALSGSK